MGDVSVLNAFIKQMAHSEVGNYVLPGLSSFQIGGEGSGMVRLFEAERQTHEFVTPHSHRFDFACLVLRGSVTNTLFLPDKGTDGDLFAERVLSPMMPPEKAHRAEGHSKSLIYDVGVTFETKRFRPSVTSYVYGEFYSMKATDIHSIKFSKDARILFFEGPKVSDASVILEPIVDGKPVPTFRVEPWMFEARS